MLSRRNFGLAMGMAAAVILTACALIASTGQKTDPSQYANRQMSSIILHSETP